VTGEKMPTSIIGALAAVMAELPGIGKDGKAAKEQGGYAYRGIEAITREVQPLFAKYGVVFVPRVVSHEIRDITVNSKPWTDTVALIEYDVYGPGGPEDKIVVGPILAIGRDNSDKGANKCATQALKYALLQTLCISDAKDDSDQGSPEADERRAAPVDEAAIALRLEIQKAVGDGKITADQAQEAAVKHGVGTAALLNRASADVLRSMIETLGLNEKETASA
jgi:hypothetical protein